jgi:hypothetical protein
MTQDQWTKVWKAVASIAVALSVIATALAGISISTNQAQTAEINQLQGQAAAGDVQARGGNTPIYFDQGGKQLTIGSAATLTVASGGALNVASGGSLLFASVGISGAIHYGAQDGYTSGAQIKHGFATTPTMCVLLPVRDVTSTLTITSTGLSSNEATIAAGTSVRWLCGQ